MGLIGARWAKFVDGKSSHLACGNHLPNGSAPWQFGVKGDALSRYCRIKVTNDNALPAITGQSSLCIQRIRSGEPSWTISICN